MSPLECMRKHEKSILYKLDVSQSKIWSLIHEAEPSALLKLNLTDQLPITFVPNSEHFDYSIKCLPWNDKVSDSIVEIE